MNNCDIYQKITDNIIARLDAGVIPWRRGWNAAKGGDVPANLVSGKAYRGVNVWLLASAGFTSPLWATFKQIKDKGGNVRKGEKSQLVVFWSILKKEDKANPGTHKKIFFLRYYNVFNVEQCDGLERFQPGAVDAPVFQPIATAENMLSLYDDCPSIVHRGGEAFYSPTFDQIQMPKREAFNAPENYYSVLYHEAAHSTGHASRLARPGIVQFDRFGSEKYSREELVAEFAATFLCGLCGIEQPIIDNAASYIAGWSKKLKAEPDLFLKAASEAQRAVEYIRGKRETEGEESEQPEGAELATA